MNLNKHFEGSVGGTGGEAGGFRRGSGLVAGQGFELRSIGPWSSSMLPLCPADSWLAEAPPDPPWVHRHCDVPWNVGPGTPGPSQDCQQVCTRVVRGVPTLLHGHCSMTHKICNLGICSLERRRQASDGAGRLQGSESLNSCLILQGDSWYLHILFQGQGWAQQLGPWQGVCQVLPLPWQESQASQHRVPSPPSTHHACSMSSSKPAAFSLPQAGLVPKSPLISWYKVAVYVLHFSNHLIKR